MSKQLGDRILSTLKSQKMTQVELAKKLNISEAVLSRYISGEREPKPDMLAQIASTLQTTSDYLLGIEKNDFDFPKIKRMIARNSENITDEEKKELINALFGGV